MSRETWSWWSPRLRREMPVARWGHFGRPILLFPTAGGDFLECERFLMVRALTPLIEAGRIKLYSCGSISSEAWMDERAHPAHKSWLQARFDDYVIDELVPFVREDCGGAVARIACAGASLGAYNAVNAGLKHPDAFDLVIGMSGTYVFDRWMHGHWDESYYYNQPMQYLPRMSPGLQLDLLRSTRFVIATGRGRWEDPAQSVLLAEMLDGKGIPTNLELWGHDQDHDWPTWRAMLPLFLDKLA